MTLLKVVDVVEEGVETLEVAVAVEAAEVEEEEVKTGEVEEEAEEYRS